MSAVTTARMAQDRSPERSRAGTEVLEATPDLGSKDAAAESQQAGR